MCEQASEDLQNGHWLGEATFMCSETLKVNILLCAKAAMNQTLIAVAVMAKLYTESLRS